MTSLGPISSGGYRRWPYPVRPLRRFAAPIDRLLARLPEPVEARIRDRLGLDLFVVVAAVVVVLRLFDTQPWTPWVLDMHTYWATGDGYSYNQGDPYTIGAYLYAPAFAQLLWPITTLPWPWFAALWTAAIAATYVWLVGRWAVPRQLTGAVAREM